MGIVYERRPWCIGLTVKIVTGHEQPNRNGAFEECSLLSQSVLRFFFVGDVRKDQKLMFNHFQTNNCEANCFGCIKHTGLNNEHN